jgi:thiol-disulfide isomerase/thioredoxin
MTIRYLNLFVVSFFLIPVSLTAQNAESIRLNELREVIRQNVKADLLQDVGKKRLAKEDVTATVAVYEAAEKILANQNIPEEFRLWTIKYKVLALIILAYEETPRYFPHLSKVINELVEVVDELGVKKDQSPQLKDYSLLLQMAELHFLAIGSVMAIHPVDKKLQIDLQSLTERIILFAKNYPGTDADRLMKQLLKMIDAIAQPAIRDKRLAAVAPFLIQYFLETNRDAEANRLITDSRRVLLPGNPMTINGYLLEGKIFDAQTLKDKVVLIQFWGTWCPHCKEMIPDLIGLYEKYHSKGLEIIGVNTAVKGDENPAKVREFLSTTGFGTKRRMIPWTILHEGITAASIRQKGLQTMTQYYGIDELPVLILIGRNGLVIKIHPLLSTLDAEIHTALNAVVLTPEEQALADAAKKEQESRIDKEIEKELQSLEKE